MIAVSDAVLILVSAAALGIGLNRWQNNLELNTRPAASVQTQGVVVPQVQNTSTINTSTAPTVTPEPPQTVAVDATSSASSEADNSAPRFGIYVVQSGDSLSKIAVQYDTSVRALQSINELEGTVINIGQELKYPLPAN